MISVPNSELQWHRSENPVALCNESYPFLSIESDYDNQDGTFRRTHNRTTLGDFQWNDGSSHNSGITYSSLACPRDFAQEIDTAARATAGSISPAHHSATYSINPFDRSTHASVSMYQNFQSNLTTSREELSSLHPINETFQSYTPTLSRSLSEVTRPDVGPTTTPGGIKNDSRGPSAEAAIEESDGDASVTSEPYAQLIYRALMSTPQHKMVLREIYDWFEKHTDKAKSKGSKGWQNSIRHNLSMNGVSFKNWQCLVDVLTNMQAFKKVDQAPPSDESKKGFIWVLEPSAMEKGVESTTRYRRTGPGKKTSRTEPAATQRQRSGAKGGKAARRVAKLKRCAKLEESKAPRCLEKGTDDQQASFSSENNFDPNLIEYDLTQIPYYMATPTSTVHSPFDSDMSRYSYGDIIGCAGSLDNEPLFYDEFEHAPDPALPSSSLREPNEHLLGHAFNLKS